MIPTLKACEIMRDPTSSISRSVSAQSVLLRLQPSTIITAPRPMDRITDRTLPTRKLDRIVASPAGARPIVLEVRRDNVRPGRKRRVAHRRVAVVEDSAHGLVSSCADPVARADLGLDVFVVGAAEGVVELEQSSPC